MKKTILGSICVTTVIAVTLLFSCSKKENNPTSSPTSIGETTTNNSSASSVMLGKENKNLNLFSKDAVTGVVYNIKVTFDQDGSATIERSVVEGHQNANVAVQFIANEVPYIFDGDTIKIEGKVGKIFYQIPFEPQTPICNVVDGGPAGKVYCQKGCNDATSTCRTDDDGSHGDGIGHTTGCSGSCTDCKQVSEGCGTGSAGGVSEKLTKSGGVVIVATSINVLN